MLVYIHFTGWSLLLLILLLAPLAYYIIKAQDKERDADPIAPVDNPLNFDDLAPVDNAEQSEAYLKALRWALGNAKIKNVAVTGPYGSGKSSILETFRKQYENNFHFLNISLASFVDGKKNDPKPAAVPLPPKEGEEKSAEERKNETQQLIELSILQQIFYKVDQAQLPDSRFKRISGLSQSFMIFFVLGVFGFLLGSIFLIFPKQAQQFSFLDSFSRNNPDSWHLFLLVITLPALIWIIVYLIHFFRAAGLKKLNITSGEIEIDPKSETSILNRYLDELVYFFSVTDFNVVLIEDMDRFSDPEIFTKLRELNTLINSSSQVGRRIVFVYAIKDDNFPDERTRTKFFDFIIPVIPIVNWSNSLQKLKDKLDAAGFKIEHRFVTAITLYIDDMRVLKNIFNELMLYNEALSIPPERQTKLLAMIAYKNIYPNDFAALHEERGTVHDILLKAQAVREEIVTDVDKKIAVKEEFSSDADDMVPYNINELRAAYILAIIDSLDNFNYFLIGGQRKAFAELYQDDNFKILTAGKNVRYYSQSQGNTTASYSFEEIENEVSPGETYAEREQRIYAKSDAGMAKLNREIEALRAERDKVKAYSVAEIVRAKTSQFPDIAETKTENKLLRYLLSEGYIDPSYPYLISYFYPGTIGRADMKFLTFINDRNALAYDYTLEKPAGLIDMLSDYDFERDIIFNVDLLNALLADPAKYSRPAEKVIDQLNSKSKRGLDFILVYLEKGSHIARFVRLLCKAWPGIFKHYHSSKVSTLLPDRLLKLILLHADLDDLPAINKDGVLTTYIDANYDLMATFAPGIIAERMNGILEKLSVKFADLVPDEQLLLFDQVYAGDFYVLTFDNIARIIRNKSTATLEQKALETANFSSIVASGCDGLYNYVDQEISAYADAVLLKLSGQLNDSEKDVIYLLNDEDLTPEQKTKIIQKETAIIQKLEEVDNADLYPQLLRHNRVAATWPNILHYNHEEIDEHMLHFLNNVDNARNLGSTTLEPTADCDQKATNAFERKLIETNAIRIDSYRELLQSFAPGYSELNTEVLAGDKVEALIAQHLLFVEPGLFTDLKTNHPPLQIALLLDDTEQFFESIEEIPLDNNDRLALLAPGKMDTALQLKLIKTITPAMIRENSQLATRITTILVTANELDMDEEMLFALTDNGQIAHNKLILFNYHLPNLDDAAIRQVLEDIGGDYARLNEGKRPKMDLTPLNESIAGKLQDKGYIKSAKIDTDKGTIRFRSRP